MGPRRIIIALVAAAALTALLWFLFGRERVSERVRTEAVEMLDLAEPTDPPEVADEPEPEPETPPAPETAEPVAETPLDPLEQMIAQELENEPTGGSLAGLTDGPAFDQGTVAGIGPGGGGPLAGGVRGRGSGLTLTYAQEVQAQMIRYLRRDRQLTYAEYDLVIVIRVRPDASVEIVSIESVRPPSLRRQIETALAAFTRVRRAPRPGDPTVMRLEFNQIA